MIRPNGEKHLIVLLGPTGVGKTSLSLTLSRHFNAPVISSDSRQFFREMSIGTAYPSPEVLASAPHYLIGNKSVTERYSCGLFEVDALKLLEDLFSNHDIALLVGGSGLYINAVCDGIDDFPAPDPEIRKNLEYQLKNEGLESLRMQLKKLDPDYYFKVDLKNSQRIVKALEVCLQTGNTYSSYLRNKSKVRNFKTLKIGLNRPREELYKLIDNRVDSMIAHGLVDEVKNLYQYRYLNALKTVGYKEIVDYLDQKITLAQAISLIKRNTRRYAKRQLTWWAKDTEIHWFHPDNVSEIVEFIGDKLSLHKV